MLTAFLIPQATPEIDSSDKFLASISEGKYTIAVETTWALYLSLTDEKVKQVGALEQISDTIRNYGVRDVPDTYSAAEVAMNK